MRFNNKKFIYMYSLTAIAIASFFIFAITSPAYAEVPSGFSFDGYKITIYTQGGTTQNLTTTSNSRVSYINEQPTAANLRYIRFQLNHPYTNFTKPVAIFAMSGWFFSPSSSTVTELFNNADQGDQTIVTFSQYNDYGISFNNDTVYKKAFGKLSSGVLNVRYYLYFIPVQYIVQNNTSNEQMLLNFTTNEYAVNHGQVSSNITFQYLGETDMESDNIVQYIDNIESSLLSLDQKLDAIISILENQQSEQQASSSINSAETVHNNIDQIQNSSGTNLSNGFNSFINNPDLTLNTATIAGASFLATLSTSIFNNVGIFNWIFIFPAFIGLGTYLIGRGAKVLK